MMSEFVNPFSGRIPERALTSEELVRDIRPGDNLEFYKVESLALHIKMQGATCVLSSVEEADPPIG
jgi:hypothetical protein